MNKMGGLLGSQFEGNWTNWTKNFEVDSDFSCVSCKIPAFSLAPIRFKVPQDSFIVHLIW